MTDLRLKELGPPTPPESGILRRIFFNPLHNPVNGTVATPLLQLDLNRGGNTEVNNPREVDKFWLVKCVVTIALATIQWFELYQLWVEVVPSFSRSAEGVPSFPRSATIGLIAGFSGLLTGYSYFKGQKLL